MVIARSYILACGRRGAANGASHRAVSASLPKQGERSGGIRKLLSLVPSGLPRARAAVRRWSTFAFEVHASTYVWFFGCFGVNWRAAMTALSILLAGTGGAWRANRRKSMRRIGRAHGSWDLAGTALPDRSGLFARMHAARRSARGLWNAYLENLPRGPHSSGSAGGAAFFRGTDIVPYLE